MSALPSFSVVVPLYNKEALVETTLRSVMAQTMSPLEIVVVDDGSRDGSADVVRALGDPRIRLVQQPNGGVARARNAGVAQASGEWIAFLDADDWQHPRYLEALSRVIAQHPGVDMVATRYTSVDESRMATLQPWDADLDAPIESIADLPARWQLGTTFFTSSVAVRRERLAAMQPCFPPGEHFGEDVDLWFRLAEQGPIAMHSAPLVARVWTSGGLSVTQVAKAEAPFALRMEQRARTGTLPSELAASTLHFVDQSRISLARDAISAGQRGLALELLSRARGHWTSRRWLLTAAMALLLPGPWVYKWQRWRKRRKMVLG